MARSAAHIGNQVSLVQRYLSVRAATRRLIEPLSAEDCQVQSMPDVSPAKWHLAHVTWFFETFLVRPNQPDYTCYDESFHYLFNSYYNSLGEQYPRPRRGLITRPSLDQVLHYRRQADDAVVALIEGDTLDQTAEAVLELGLQHEQQHQELLLMDIKHVFFCNPNYPAYRPAASVTEPSNAAPPEWHGFPEGLRQIGHAGAGFAFDNEMPRHREYVHAFEVAHRPVSNGEYRAFIQDGGYREPLIWLSDGWSTIQTQAWRAPLYWIERDGEWFEFTLQGLKALDPAAPVCHLSYFEADAYAQWAGARLPTEAEWETAAAAAPMTGNFVESERLHPAPWQANDGLAQLFGDVWEWTSSAYAPYPGYKTANGALGEYNGKFMCGQYVMRGGSCLTPQSHMRATYRNFFYPRMRWQCGGLRLARDGG